MRTRDKLAPAKFGFSFTAPPRITRLSMLLPERSAPVKFAPMSHAPFRFARASVAPERLADTSRVANRFAPDRFARLKSTLLRSRSERSLPEKSTDLSRGALARTARTSSARRSAACADPVTASAKRTAPAARSATALKMGGMKPKMIFDKRRDEEVAVVVTVSQTKVERNAAALARFAQQLGFELAFDELIVGSLIDKYRRTAPAAVFDQCGGVVLAPSRRIGAQVSGQRFLSPRAAHRRRDRRERRHGLVAARILERDGERTMPAH